MKVADTSALYAAVVRNDPFYQEAVDAIASGVPILVPAEILSETLALIQYRHGSAAAIQAQQTFRGKSNMEIQPTPDDFWDDILGAATKIHAAHPQLSYPDAIVVAWCRSRGLQPFAFDQAILDAVSA